MSITVSLAVIYTVLSLWILIFIIVFRHRLSSMVGMISAMTQGMTVGLGFGTLFVIWLPLEFFHATVFSMLIAGAIGGASGFPISIMAVLDGLLSGFMAGMMGTMFIVMIPQTYTESAIRVMAVLCSGVLFLLLLLLQSEVQTEHLQKRSYLLTKPGYMFAVIILSFIIQLSSSFNLHLDIPFINKNEQPRTPHQHQE